jgi:tetratricopeptide (TPR) repeat protein
MGWQKKIVDLFFESDEPARTSFAHNSRLARPWSTGYLIKNRYEILQMSKSDRCIVYIARDQEAKKTVSITTIQDNLLKDNDTVEYFREGAQVWINLGHHTNIVFADFVETIEGKPLLFSEYVNDGDLRQYMKGLTVEKTLDFAIQFCTGMEYAYEKLNIIHGDVKPSCVMVQKNPVFRYGYCFKIRDFGITQAFKQDPRHIPGGISTDVGTFYFIPPEQFPERIQENFSFHGTITTKSDIYSFGVLLYVMVAGKPPFYGLDEIFCGCPESPGNLNIRIPESLDYLIGKCMRRKSDDRYDHFGELKNELMRIFREQTGENYAIIGKKEAWARNERDNSREICGNPNRSENQVSPEREPFDDPDNFDEIVAAFECSVMLEPDNGDVLVNKGDFLAELGRYEEAVSEYSRALERSPGDARTWLNQCMLLARLGRLEEALSSCTRALERLPDDSKAWNNKGVLLAGLGRYEEAVLAYARALELSPDNPKVWNNKGDALAEMGRFEEAVSAFQHVGALNPEDTDEWYAGGNSPAVLGRFESTNLSFREDKQKPQEAEKWYCEGESLARRGKFEEAVSAYDHATTLKPDYADAWLNKGTAYGILGNDLEAVRCFGRFIDLAPPEYASQVKDVEHLIGQMKP